MSGDWLDPEKEPLPDDVTLPPMPLTLREITIAGDALKKREKFIKAWVSLSEKQRVYLTIWRESRFNQRRALRELAGTAFAVSKTTLTSGWTHDKNFEYARALLREASVDEVMDKAHLVHRQNDIVETLLEPKPILFQGQPTGYYEVEAGAAGRANEVLLDRAMPKPRADVEVNVGVAFIPPSVEVVNSAGANDSVDAEFVEVSPALPDEDWSNGANESGEVRVGASPLRDS